MVFYSKDDPSWYDVENPENSRPGPDPDRTARDGVAVVCPCQDHICIEKTREALGPNLPGEGNHRGETDAMAASAG